MCIQNEYPFYGSSKKTVTVWKAVMPTYNYRHVQPLYQSSTPFRGGKWLNAKRVPSWSIYDTWGWHAHGSLGRARRDEPDRIYIKCRIKGILARNKYGDVRGKFLYISKKELRRAEAVARRRGV